MNCLEIYCYSTTIGATEWGHGATALSLCKKPATEQKEWGAGPVKCVDTKDELNPLRNVVYLSPPISTFFLRNGQLERDVNFYACSTWFRGVSYQLPDWFDTICSYKRIAPMVDPHYPANPS